MAEVGRLNVGVGFKVDRNSQRAVQKAIGGLKQLATGFIAAFASRAAINGIRNVTSEIVRLGDSLEKTSRQIGVSTDALQELGFAAGLSGSSNEELIKGIRTLTRNANEARQGLQSFKQDFDRVGVSVTDANGNLKDAETLFVEFGLGLQRLEDSSERVALAQAIMGRAGTKLIPIFDKGAAGLEAMRQEARKLGIVSNQTIMLSAEFEDAQLRLNQSMILVKDAIGRGILPPLLKMIRATRQWITANRTFLRQRVFAAFRRIGEFVERVSFGFSKATDLVIEFVSGLDSLQKSLLGTSAVFLGFAAALSNPFTAIAAVIGGILLLIEDIVVFSRGGESGIGFLIVNFKALLKVINQEADPRDSFIVLVFKWAAFWIGRATKSLKNLRAEFTDFGDTGFKSFAKRIEEATGGLVSETPLSERLLRRAVDFVAPPRAATGVPTGQGNDIAKTLIERFEQNLTFSLSPFDTSGITQGIVNAVDDANVSAREESR
jgi:hypothetical protein